MPWKIKGEYRQILFEPIEQEEPESILETSFLSENNAEPELFEHMQLKLPSTFNPQIPSNLEYTYNILIDRILSDCPESNRRGNLTIKQFRALTDLRENKSIVIKKADKGSYIQNVSDYLAEGLKQLADTKFYVELDHDPTMKFRQRIHSYLDRMFTEKQFSEKTFNFLTQGGKRRSIFYMLPKIHKNKIPPPGRPIVSSVDSPTEKFLYC